MGYDAKVICDSHCEGQRLTTMQLTHPRIIHSEFLTHCMFARNASSSRAIPFAKMALTVQEDPFLPVWWGKNQSGMQAKEEISLIEQEAAKEIWLSARDSMVEHATLLNQLGVHKQICNRLLEPFGWITVCITADAGGWANYFALRCHEDAQPEIQKQAYMAQLLYFKHEPKELKEGEWHLPYIHPEEKIHEAFQVRVSTGRCARTSYLTQEGTRDIDKDVELHDKLLISKPPHASPFEHPAMAMGDKKRYGKYTGWKSYRHMIPGEYTTRFVPNHPELVK